MKGIDIIEAMDRIDESLIIGAKQHKRSAPMWMRWVAMAACFCCIITLGAFSLRSILTPVTEEVSPGALTSTPEETISVPPTTEPTEVPSVLLHSEKYDLDLSVPEQYVDEISIDTPYTFTYWTITEEILLNNAVFTFVDHTTQSLGGDGYVWTISKYHKEDFDWDEYNLYLEMDGLLNSLVIATDDTYVYELSHSSAIDQIAEGSRDSLISYYEHCMAGYEILEDFVAQNGLTRNDDDFDRYMQYLEETVVEMYDQYTNLESDTQEEYTMLTGVAGGTGLTADLYVPLRYKDSIDIATPCEFIWNETGVDLVYDYSNAVFSFYDRNQEAYGYDGLVWIITEDPIENKDSIMKYDSEHGSLYYIFNHRILGMNEHKIYSLVTISPKYADSRRYSIDNLAAIESYYQHVIDGITILEDFVVRNRLEVPEGIVSWREWYENNVVNIVKEQLESVPETIKIAVHYETEFSMLGNIINSFNETHDEYQVELIDMREYVPNDNAQLSQGVSGWKSALNANSDIDLISAIPAWASVLGQAGYLADLNEYINTDNMLPSLWNATKTGNANYCLPYEFYVETLYAKSEHIGSRNMLPVRDFISFTESGLSLFPELTGADYINYLANNTTTACYIDLESGNCYYNSEDFIALLAYANTLPKTTASLYADGYKYLRYNEALFLPSSLSDFQSIHENETTYIDAPLTMTSWPNENGGSFNVNGGIALTKDGADNKGAIEFLKYILSDSVQDEIMSLYFPVTITAIDRMCQKMLEEPNPQYMYNNSSTENVDGQTYQYEPITEEKLDEYRDWLNGIDTFVIWSDEITTIIKEESASMLGGSQTAPEAADRIQERVTEYLDELFR